MLKIVVFDGGWGGEVVANFLDEELGVVEIIRVIDWKNTPYDEKSLTEIVGFAEESLKNYFGKVDLIVLGGYATGLAINILREKYPEQKFVRPEINYDLILRARTFPEQIAILAGKTVNNLLVQGEIREKLPYSTLILPDCSGWEELINEDMMTKDILQTELALDFTLQKNQKLPDDNRKKFKPDVTIILNTHYWAVRKELEEIFGWRTRVIDFRQKFLHDVCFALKLRGVDGKRAK